MTVLDDRQLLEWPRERPGACARPVGGGVRRPASRRRPSVAPLEYRRSGVRVSQAVHNGRRVSTTASIALAALAGLITLWLGALGQFSAGQAVGAAQPADRLAVVQVQPGETLARLAARVSPEAPTEQVVRRIRELNKLDSASLDTGQTLIAPVG